MAVLVDLFSSFLSNLVENISLIFLEKSFSYYPSLFQCQGLLNPSLSVEIALLKDAFDVESAHILNQFRSQIVHL